MRFGNLVSAALLCAAVNGCGPSPEEKHIATFVEKAKTYTANTLVDPSSAQFRSLRYAKQPNGSEVLCGEINARNRMGGYVGFNTFIMTKKDEKQVVGMPDVPRGLVSGIRCQVEKDKMFVWLDAHPNRTDQEYANAMKDWDAMGCDNNDVELWSVIAPACAAYVPIADGPDRP